VIAFGALVAIVLTAVAAAILIGALAVVALRMTRRASIVVRLFLVVAATVISIVAATLAIAREMYISGHDLMVLCWVIGISALASLGVAAVIGLGLARAGVQLRASAHAIGDGSVVVAKEHEGREFASLARELADMSERLALARVRAETADESRRRLFAWIAHDLRTPLAALQAMAESLEDRVAEDPVRYYGQIRAQAETLAGMVDDVFELSKIQSGTLTLQMERLSLFDLISDSVAELHPLAARRSITLRESSSEDVTVWGDARELSRVVSNLLINAIQHSPANSEILITAHETVSGFASLSVVDAGGGIPETDLARIFDPGWRGTDARTPPSKVGPSAGAGLGLAIVRGIVQAHSGGVSAHNIPGGCQFEVTLPRFAPPVRTA
jgi:signal transduction histidine kinase